METMKQVNREETELGMNSQEGLDAVPEPKRTKLDIDDPNVTKVEGDTQNLSYPVEDDGKNPLFAMYKDYDVDGRRSKLFREFLERNVPKSAPKTREEEYEFGMLKVFDMKLAESGVDIKAMREGWKTCKTRCQNCGDIDYHPDDECPYDSIASFLDSVTIITSHYQA